MEGMKCLTELLRDLEYKAFSTMPLGVGLCDEIDDETIVSDKDTWTMCFNYIIGRPDLLHHFPVQERTKNSETALREKLAGISSTVDAR